MEKNRLSAFCGSFVLVILLAASVFTTTGTAATPNVITLRFSSHLPKGAPGQPLHVQNEILDQIEKNTNGRIKFERHFSASLAGQTDVADLLKAGTMDVALIAPVALPAKLPLTSAIDSVPFQPKSMRQAVNAFWKLKDEPSIQAEWKAQNMRIVGLTTAAGKEIGSRIPLRSLDDIKGVKARLGSESHQKIWAAAGGVPIFIPMQEVWDALDKRVVQASDSNPEGHLMFKYYESCKYYVNITLGCWVGVVAMNINSFNKLPDDLKTKVLETFEQQAQKTVEVGEAADKIQRKQLVDLKVEFIDFSAADMKKWQNMPRVQAIVGEWIKDKQNKGLPGQEIMDKYLALLKQYEK